MHTCFSFTPALRCPRPWLARIRFFLPAVLALAALCLAVPLRAHAEPPGEAKDAIRPEAVHLDAARLKAQQQHIAKEFRPALNTLLNNDDVLVRCATLYAGVGIIKDKTLSDLLRQRRSRAKFPEVVFINAFIAGATDAAADVSTFLDSLPDTFTGCETLYNFEGGISESLPLRLVEQAYGYYARGDEFAAAAAPKIVWGETFVLSQFLSSEATGHAQSDPRLQAWMAAHPNFSAEFEAQAQQAFATEPIHTTDNTPGNETLNRAPGLPVKEDQALSALSAFFDNPDPLTRLTALRMAGRLTDTEKALARRLALAKDPKEKLLLYRELSWPSLIHGGPDFIAELVREYPRTRDGYAKLLEWEYTIYGPELPTLALLADASDITRDSLAEARPVLRLVLPWAALYLNEVQNARYSQIAAGKFVTGEFYYWEAKALEALSGDTLLIEINSLGDTAKFRLTGVDCPYPGQPGYEDALARTKELVLGQKVILRSGGEDAWGRRTGWVEYGTEYKLLGQTLIREGLAVCPPPGSDEHALFYAIEEKAARAARRGLWALPDAESPATFRQRQIAETGQDPEAEK